MFKASFLQKNQPRPKHKPRSERPKISPMRKLGEEVYLIRFHRSSRRISSQINQDQNTRPRGAAISLARYVRAGGRFMGYE
jgi:hypothetical protein